MDKVVIIGYGYVGKAAYEMMKDHYCVWIYDPSIEGYDIWPEDNYSDCSMAIVCVPTPTAKDDSCDTSIVEDTIRKLDSSLILIKSTVEPGTIDRMKKETGKRIIFSPEYIGESTYSHPYPFNESMAACPFLILGGDKKDTKSVLDLLVPVLGPKKTYYQVTAKEAETIKYMENTYFGMKVTFANEMANVCKALGVDYYSVRTGWALDPRVDEMHTMVFPNKPGFGGKCLPKDIKAIVRASEKAGYVPDMFKQILRSNNQFKEELGLDKV